MRWCALTLVVSLLAGVGRAHADTPAASVTPAPAASPARRVLCYGDSITFGIGGRGTSYPSILQRRRPDLAVVNGGLPRDVSSNLARLQALLDAQTYDDVVILIGSNDPIVERITPAETVQRILDLVSAVRKHGARAWVLTPTPAACVPPSYVCANMRMRQAHTRAVAELIMAEGKGSTAFVALDLRGAFDGLDWRALSFDGLHPNAAGYRVIAGFVAEALGRLPGAHPAVGTPAR